MRRNTVNSRHRASLVNRYINNHGTRLHGFYHFLGYQFWRFSSRQQHSAHQQVRLFHPFSQVETVRHNGLYATAKNIIQISKTFRRTIQHSNTSAHAYGYFGSIGTNDAAADNDDLSYFYPWNAAQKNSFAATRLFQELSANLHRHTSSYFAHRRQ